MSNPSTQTTSAKNTKYTRVGDIASGRAGDKGNVLDLTLVARDDAAYEWLARTLTADTVRRELNRVVSGSPTCAHSRTCCPKRSAAVSTPRCGPDYIGRKQRFGCCSI